MILMAGATTMTRKKTLAVHLEIGGNIFFSFVQLRKLQPCEFQSQFHSFFVSISQLQKLSVQGTHCRQKS